MYKTYSTIGSEQLATESNAGHDTNKMQSLSVKDVKEQANNELT